MKKPLIKNSLEIVQGNENDWLFEQRETQKRHSPYEWEELFFSCIAEGNVTRLEQMIVDFSRTQLLVGKLSSNELRQAQYLAVAFITLAIRYAIRGGMFEMDAYNKSDALIQKVDRLKTSDEVIQLIVDTMRDLTLEIHDIKIRQTYSTVIRDCLEYIYQNLHSKIQLKGLAGKCNLSAPYLSALFKKEVGVHLTTYIMQQKIKAAQSMLLHSSMTEKEISNYLEFSSQSYFINCFKRVCGLTPGVYKKQNYP